MYNAGLGITLTLMLVKGTLTVLGKEDSSRLLAWSAGGGHILLTFGFYYFFVTLMKAVREDEEKK
ncbi:hypothetical protein AGDE_06311 [Angomonas deanei]|uniref:Uncharacterized protein n=1 Tax=Angomonas deanei TaxID=59799 RepID=A0A7G2CRV9_9TRYP|nr:hypothetical protein AGDE_06311 [Angomonas deanei]CAD2221897.1 Protein of unknown function (DUF2871), putative [Angomonas deanei]|eukprot:EPY37623.1 hypothetical protein AGDE_06311 [Angomonas deanei]